MREAESQTFLIGCGLAATADATPETLGFKAYNLWRMERVGLPVPPAFVLDTGFCRDFFRKDRKPSTGLRELLSSRMRELERSGGLAFGSTRKPLLVSVRSGAPEAERLASVLPQVQAEIVKVAGRLEAEFRDMQEFEFTVQDGRLFVLQTRTGKRMPWAALRIAVDLVDADRISESDALDRLAEIDLDRIARLKVVRENSTRVLCRAVPAGIGVAVGEIALDSARALEVAAAGRSAILVRDTTSTDPIPGYSMRIGHWRRCMQICTTLACSAQRGRLSPGLRICRQQFTLMSRAVCGWTAIRSAVRRSLLDKPF